MNAVMKWQIVARDAEKTADFFASLFGWSVDASNKLGYRELRSGADRGVDGGVWPHPEAQTDFVQLFVEVEDVEAAIAKASALGAAVVVPKSTLPDGDTIAILATPAGLSFGVMTRR